jgi:hypothetical protein
VAVGETPGLKLGRMTLIEVTHKNPVPTAKIRQYAVKANPLTLFSETIGVYSKKHINLSYGKTQCSLMLQADKHI